MRSEYTHYFVSEINKRAAADGFHRDNRYPALLAQLHTTQTRLILSIHIIVLNLTKIPVSVIDNILKNIIPVVKAKAQMTNFPLLFKLVKKLVQSKPFNELKPVAVKGVKQVKIYMIRLQLF